MGMTYDEAKVAECLRKGIGASFSEIKHLMHHWDRDRIVNALSCLGSKGWADIKLVEGQVIFSLTDGGEAEYQAWSDISF